MCWLHRLQQDTYTPMCQLLSSYVLFGVLRSSADNNYATCFHTASLFLTAAMLNDQYAAFGQLIAMKSMRMLYGQLGCKAALARAWCMFASASIAMYCNTVPTSDYFFVGASADL
eukprot:TRINITY_DN46453_c0_g1_i1.p2 TRINITY_DN46453_c0_g1~~TRINITY_DN46453_c0_g1_i1.p2  ORF type:complete len:115 (+),score=13.42 TRINITY_DN46453_c0_g1_i1:237-581(+)